LHPRICAVVAVAAVLGSLLALAAPRATAATRHPVMGCTKVATGDSFLEYAPSGRCRVLLDPSEFPIPANDVAYITGTHWKHWGSARVTGTGWFGLGLGGARVAKATMVLSRKRSDCGEAGPAYTRLKVSWRGFREKGFPATVSGSDVFDLLAEVGC
jgi:hypothetical protein